MGQRQKQSSSERQVLRESGQTQTKKYSERMMEGSKSYTNFNKRFHSSMYASTKSESSSMKAKQCNSSHSSSFQESKPISSNQPRLKETVCIRSESNKNEGEISKSMKKTDEDPSRSFNESEKSLDPRNQMSSDKTMDSSENLEDLNKRFDSSLIISMKPEQNLTKVESPQKCNSPQPLGFQESRSNKLSRRPSLMETLYRPYESSPSKDEIPNNMKDADHKSSSANNKTVYLKQKVGIQQQPRSQSRGGSEYLKSTYGKSEQDFSRTFPVKSTPEYHLNTSAALLHGNTNPLENQESENTGFAEPNVICVPKTEGTFYHQTALPAFKQNNIKKTPLSSHMYVTMPLNQLQTPFPNFTTTAPPVVLLSQDKKTSYYTNPMIPISTNARHMRFVQHPIYNRNPMPRVRMNAAPMRYFPPSSHYRNYKAPFRKNATSKQNIPRPETATAKVSVGTELVSDKIDIVDFTSEMPDQVSKSTRMQPQKLTPKEIDSLNTTASNPEQSKNLTNKEVEELAKTTDFSKKNVLNVDVPPKPPAISFFPLYSSYQSGISTKLLQQTPVHFPTPASKDFFIYTSALKRAIQHPPHQYLGNCSRSTSNVYSYINPVAANQPATRLITPDNVLMQAGSYVGNSVQPVNEATTMSHYGVQYQPVIENLQYPNHPIYQYETHYQPATLDLVSEPRYQNPNFPMDQYQPTMENITATQQYEYPNQPIYQFGSALNSNVENLTAEQQCQDPYLPIYQNGMQYQFPMRDLNTELTCQDPNTPIDQYRHSMQNLIAAPQYQDPNQPMYEYGNQTSLDIPWSTDTSFSYPIYNTNISSQQTNSNIVPMQTPAINLSSTCLLQNTIWPYASDDSSYPCMVDPNLVSNFSGIQTAEENPSSMNMNHYPPWMTPQ